jgi:hypothetical protein
MALKNDFIIIKKVSEFDYGLLKESDLIGPSREFFLGFHQVPGVSIVDFKINNSNCLARPPNEPYKIALQKKFMQ